MTQPAYGLIRNAHIDQARARLEALFGRLDAAEAVGVIRKSELADLRQGFNRAFEKAWRMWVKELHVYGVGSYDKLTEAEKALERSILYPEAHTAAGIQKRVDKAQKAAGELRDAMVEVLKEIVPISARLEALKAKIGTPPPKATKTSIERDERDAKAMTCQCCNRSILAETGVIAHHGYERPHGTGYQTASCPGARYLPFEVSRDALGGYIAALHAYVERQVTQKRLVDTEQTGFYWTYKDRTNCTRSWEQGADMTVRLTREVFPDILSTAKAGGYKGTPTFDELKADNVARLAADIAATKDQIRLQQARYDAWTGPTHERRDDQWVALAAA